MAEYVVKKGDTLSGVFGKNWQNIAKLNKLADPNKIMVGQKLQIPDAPNTVRPAGPPSGLPKAPAPKPMSMPQSSLQAAAAKPPVTGLRLPVAKSPAQIAIDNARKAVAASNVTQFKVADRASMSKLRSDASDNRREIGTNVASALKPTTPVKSSDLPAARPAVIKPGDPRTGLPFQPTVSSLTQRGGSPFSGTTYRPIGQTGVDTAAAARRAASDTAARTAAQTKLGSNVRMVGTGTKYYVNSIRDSVEVDLAIKDMISEAIKSRAKSGYDRMFAGANIDRKASQEKFDAIKKNIQKDAEDYQKIKDKG